ncbi:MAG TPA: NAD(P)/FAD-dependent oxidoreductase, partial [Prochlorococcus sp.]
MNSHTVAVIGAGAVGASTAWHLAKHGHQVILIDPKLREPIKRSGTLPGTTASLGVLMGHVFRRTSGRAWRLRQRSMALWPNWIKELSNPEHPLQLNTPLIQLASCAAEATQMEQLAKQRQHLGLELITQNSNPCLGRSWPHTQYGGLLSHQDGYVEPISLQKCLRTALQKQEVQQIKEPVVSIERSSSTARTRWRIQLAGGMNLNNDAVVICAALGSEALIEPLGHSRPMAPVLGQVVDLELISDQNNWS